MHDEVMVEIIYSLITPHQVKHGVLSQNNFELDPVRTSNKKTKKKKLLKCPHLPPITVFSCFSLPITLSYLNYSPPFSLIIDK